MNPKPPEPNDDPDFDPQELEEAVEDVQTDATPAEVTEETEQLTEWDTPPSATGTAAPKLLPTDDTVVEELVNDGTDEAERDLRIAASDPDFEP